MSEPSGNCLQAKTIRFETKDKATTYSLFTDMRESRESRKRLPELNTLHFLRLLGNGRQSQPIESTGGGFTSDFSLVLTLTFVNKVLQEVFKLCHEMTRLRQRQDHAVNRDICVLKVNLFFNISLDQVVTAPTRT